MKWIKVTDRLPEEGQAVLCYPEYLPAEYSSYWLQWSEFYVTHWMPLPEPPKD